MARARCWHCDVSVNRGEPGTPHAGCERALRFTSAEPPPHPRSHTGRSRIEYFASGRGVLQTDLPGTGNSGLEERSTLFGGALFIVFVP